MFQSKGRSWKTLFIALVAVMAFSVMTGCGKKDDNKAAEGNKDTSKVIATYEGGEITENEFDREQRIVLALQPQMEQFMALEDFRDYLVKQEIAYEYLEANASDKEKEAGKKKADEQFEAMKTSMGAEQFKKMMDDQKLTEQDFKNYMVRVYTVMETQLNKVKDEDVTKEFEATKKNYIKTASVRHILIGFKDAEGKERKQEDALKLANDIKAKLEKGEDFATLAKKYTEDPGSKETGGLYENADVSQWVPQFREAAVTLPLNTISDPVQTDYGYHVMRVEARTDREFTDLTQEEKDMIKTSLAAGKLDEFMTGDLEKKIIKKIELPKVEQKTGEGEGAGATTPEAGTNAGTEGTTESGDGTTGDTGKAGDAGNAGNTGNTGTGTAEEKTDSK